MRAFFKSGTMTLAAALIGGTALVSAPTLSASEPFQLAQMQRDDSGAERGGGEARGGERGNRGGGGGEMRGSQQRGGEMRGGQARRRAPTLIAQAECVSSSAVKYAATIDAGIAARSVDARRSFTLAARALSCVNMARAGAVACIAATTARPASAGTTQPIAAFTAANPSQR